MISSETVIIICTALILIYWFIHHKFTYWKRNGIQYEEPSFPYGNMKGFFQTKHLNDIVSKPYKEMKDHGPICGMYLFQTPVSLILDPKLIKNILIKDFQHFMDRGLYYNEKYDPLSAHLFALDGADWKELRGKLSPTFTSGKMKYMFPTVTKVSNEFKEALQDSLKLSDEMEIKDFLARYTTDVIGTCAFGIECNSLRDPDSIFRVMGRKIFSPRKRQLIKSIGVLVSKKFAQFIGIATIPSDITKFFLDTVTDTITFREKNHVERNDFMDLMIQLKNMKSDDSSKKYSDGLSINQIAAQAFVFFIAGFETSSTLMTFALYELALNKDIQSKARKEIDEVLWKYNGEFTYEAMLDMKYIDQILNESMRKYPPVPVLMRRTTKEYRIPDIDLKLPVGLQVWLPIQLIQNDPDYYPDPEKFDPDRFTAEAIQTRDPMTFLPFGDGPRNCIGLRFGQMQARIGIVTILRNFEVLMSSKTPVPVILDPKSFILSPLGGMWLKIRKLD